MSTSHVRVVLLSDLLTVLARKKMLLYFIYLFILFYFILFYFILFYFILFYFILFYFILFYFIFLEGLMTTRGSRNM